MFLKLYLQTADYYCRISWCLGTLGLKCLHFWHNFLFSIFWLMHTKKLYQLSENPVLIWTSPAALWLFCSWKKCTNGKKKKMLFQTWGLFLSLSIFFRAVIVLPPLFSTISAEGWARGIFHCLTPEAGGCDGSEGGREGGRGGSVYIPQPPPLLLLSASATLLLPFPLRGADHPCLLVSSLNKRRDTWSCALEAVWGKPWRVRRL